MSEFNLPYLRYSTAYRFILIFDMILIVILWIIGAYLNLETREIDQIINFHFTESIFDILLIASFKALILFILVSELEKICLKLISFSRETQETQSNSNLVNTDDQDTLINNDNQKDVKFYKIIRKLLHIMILIGSLLTVVYCGVKFGFVLKLILEPIDFHHAKLPMDYFYFSVLITELALSLIQLIFSCLSWIFMRKLPILIRNRAILIETQAQKPKKIDIARLIGLSYPERYLIIVAFIMLMISSVTNIVVPFFFGSVVDAALKFKDLDEMNKYIIYMFLVFLIGSIAGGIRSWLFELAGQRVVARLRTNVFSAIIKQDIKFFDTNRTGELTSRISSDTQVLQNAVTANLSMLARYLFQIIGSVIFMFSLQASLTGLLLAVIPIVSFLTVYYGRYLRKLRKKFQDDLAASSVVAEEAISSSRTVRSFAAEEKIKLEYQKNVEKSFIVGKKLAVAGGGFMTFVGFLSGGALAIVLWYGGKLVHDEKISTGLLASFLMYTLQVAMAFAILSSLYGDFMQALGASQRIFELLDTKTTIPLNTGYKPKNEIEDENAFDGSLKFQNVCFSYPTRPDTQVLKDISFEIDRGKTFALVGPSGGGKSTIIALIERFYDPDEGNILVGSENINIKTLNTNYLHSKIALVSQEPVLFGGTIKENISFGVEGEVEIERIIEVSKLANAHDFIEGFEKGYDTVVGERGIRLSGGQKQRIAIARALLVNPKLLLLDEATSALDAESEHLVQEAIDRAMKDRTVIIIAHRLSTVRNADKVMVISQGSLVEEGTHQQLCESDGIYKRLVLRQLVDKGSNHLEILNEEK